MLALLPHLRQPGNLAIIQGLLRSARVPAAMPPCASRAERPRPQPQRQGSWEPLWMGPERRPTGGSARARTTSLGTILRCPNHCIHVGKRRIAGDVICAAENVAARAEEPDAAPGFVVYLLGRPAQQKHRAEAALEADAACHWGFDVHSDTRYYQCRLLFVKGLKTSAALV